MQSNICKVAEKRKDKQAGAEVDQVLVNLEVIIEVWAEVGFEIEAYYY